MQVYECFCQYYSQNKPTPQDSINEFIVWKMNPLIVPVTSVKFKSELLHA